LHDVRRALSFATLSAGSSIAARMAMMAITTNNSMRVKAQDAGALPFDPVRF
jgi:hypothetical protein